MIKASLALSGEKGNHTPKRTSIPQARPHAPTSAGTSPQRLLRGRRAPPPHQPPFGSFKPSCERDVSEP